jgi:pyruvate dehydrogenase E2 component (dihydrolipoamide acetyltransferase)
MGQTRQVKVPDIGDFEAVEIIDVLVAAGDRVEKDGSLVTLESDKATLDIPAPEAGTVRELHVKSGDKVSEGDLVLTLEVEGEAPAAAPARSPRPQPASTAPAPAAPEREEPGEGDSPEPEERAPGKPEEPAEDGPVDAEGFRYAHASPSVRRFARELSADLGQIRGTGRKDRITREDVAAFVRERLSAPPAVATGDGAFGLPPMPEVDFSRFGPVETRELSRIRKRAAQNLHRAWLHVPHVTQFDEADVTDLETFRQELAGEAETRGVKMTFLPFLMKAVVHALERHPEVNSSLAPGGEKLVLKKYYHLGIAVDTRDGLVVPVVRDVDRKGLFELAAEVAQVAHRAREQKLEPRDLQGASFTISSLGGLGGTAFTPIVNAPEVAILGVSRIDLRPVYRDGALSPRKILPLSFSYDHRVIDGALAARFTTYLARVLSDLRRLLL